MKTISIETWPSFIDLERAFYEKQTYESILSYMANNNIKETMGYFEDYKQVIKTYYILCRKLEKDILFPEMGDKSFTWEVDFIEHEVKIREETT